MARQLVTANVVRRVVFGDICVKAAGQFEAPGVRAAAVVAEADMKPLGQRPDGVGVLITTDRVAPEVAGRAQLALEFLDDEVLRTDQLEALELGPLVLWDLRRLAHDDLGALRLMHGAALQEALEC